MATDGERLSWFVVVGVVQSIATDYADSLERSLSELPNQMAGAKPEELERVVGALRLAVGALRHVDTVL